jgi:stage V sporulation protein B
MVNNGLCISNNRIKKINNSYLREKEMNKQKNEMIKGTSYLIISKIVFMISGYGVNIVAARKLGPESYGIIGVIIALMTVMNLFFYSGFPKAAAKYLSENKQYTKSIIKKTSFFQLIFLCITGIILIVIAPFLANLLRDPSLTPYIYLTILVVPFYAIFSLYADGFLNGYRFFKKQAYAGIVFSITKFIAVIIFLFIGLHINGVILGYLTAAFFGFLISFFYFKKIKIKGKSIFSTKKLITFSIPTILFSIFILLIFNIDVLLVKAILQENIDTGYYTSASMIARMPYYMFSGLALSILPSISHSISQNNAMQTKNQITESLRYMLLILAPIIVLISATAQPLVTLLFSATYRSAAEPLQIVVFGLGFLSFFNILSHIAMGSAKPKIPVLTAGIILIAAIALNIYFIPIYTITGAALATTLAAVIGMILMAIVIYLQNNVLIRPLTLARTAIAAFIIFYIAHHVQITGLALLLQYIVLIGLYIFILWITKEIDKKDIHRVLSILPFPHKNN